MSRERDNEHGAGPNGGKGPAPLPVPGFSVTAASDHWPAGHAPVNVWIPVEKVLAALRLADTQFPVTFRIGPIVVNIRYTLGDPGAP